METVMKLSCNESTVLVLKKKINLFFNCEKIESLKAILKLHSNDKIPKKIDICEV